MIEKIIRDLDYADYRLVDYGTNTIIVEYKENAHWRVVKGENSYILQDLINGLATVNVKRIKKDLCNKKILKWVLESLGVKNSGEIKNDSTN